MGPDKLHILHWILYEFNLKKNATQVTNSICLAYGENTLDVRIRQNWFARFKIGNFILMTRTAAEGPLK